MPGCRSARSSKAVANVYRNGSRCAHFWLTFHHKGLIEGREAFLSKLHQFASVIEDREQRLLAFIDEPRTLPEIVAHRFVYRPGQGGAMADQIEKRSMGLHLQRLMRNGAVIQKEQHYQAAK